jgi:hypothetical protein
MYGVKIKKLCFTKNVAATIKGKYQCLAQKIQINTCGSQWKKIKGSKV